MAMIRLYQNQLSLEPKLYETDDCVLLDWLAENLPQLAEKSVSVRVNGQEIANSTKHTDMDTRCSVQLGVFDCVEVFVAPRGIDPVSLAVFAVIALGAAYVAMRLMPTPEIPGDAGIGNSSPNNQLNAATNSFRPREAVPDIAGRVRAYPDFIQRSSYVYRAGLREFTEVLCIGRGHFELEGLFNGTTPFSQLPRSGYEVYEPGESVDALFDVRAAEGASSLPLLAPNAQEVTGQVDGGELRSSAAVNLVGLGGGGAEVITKLGVSTGDSVFVNFNYLNEMYQDQNFTAVLTVVEVRAHGSIEVQQTLPNALRGSVYGTIVNTTGGSTQWFTLDGSEITTARFHLVAPRGLFRENGSALTLNYALEVQEIDQAGNDVGALKTVGGSITGEGSEAIYVTRDVDVRPGRYKARARRTTNTVTDGASQTLALERLESVTAYGEPLTIEASGITTNDFDWRRFTQSQVTQAQLKLGTRVRIQQPQQGIDLITTVIGITPITGEGITLEFEDDTGGDFTTLRDVIITNRDYNERVFGDYTIIKARRGTQEAQGSGASQKLNLFATRKLELFNPATGQFTNGVFTATRSFAQYVMYLLVKVGGVRLQDVDYASLFEIENRLPEELRNFDFSFDDRNLALRDRVTAACNVARVKHYNIGSVWSFTREEAQPVRAALFNIRNMAPDGFTRVDDFNPTGSFDSVEIEYVDPETNSPAYVRRRVLPNGLFIDGLGDEPREFALGGCRSYEQALDRCNFELGRLVYQTRRATVKSTADGANVGLGMRVGVADPYSQRVFSGEVLGVNGYTLQLSERFTPQAGAGDYYIYITDREGRVSPLTLATPVPGNEFAVAAQGLSPFLADGVTAQLGSTYLIATADLASASDWIVVSRSTPDSQGYVELELIGYDARVYPESENSPTTEMSGVDLRYANPENRVVFSEPTFFRSYFPANREFAFYLLGRNGSDLFENFFNAIVENGEFSREAGREFLSLNGTDAFVSLTGFTFRSMAGLPDTTSDGLTVGGFFRFPSVAQTHDKWLWSAFNNYPSGGLGAKIVNGRLRLLRGTTFIEAPTVLQSNRWYSIFFRYSRLNGQGEIFIDGVQAAAGDISGFLPYNTSLPDGDVEVGRNFITEQYMAMDVYRLRVATRSLPDFEVEQLSISRQFTLRLRNTANGQVTQIPDEWVLVTAENRMEFTVPPGFTFADYEVWAEDNEGQQTPRYPFTVRQMQLEPGFVEDFNDPLVFQQRWQAIHRGWGGGNGGVVVDNVFLTEYNGETVLALEAHGDLYEGDVQGMDNHGAPKFNEDGTPWVKRVGAVLVARNYTGYGSYEFEAISLPVLGATSAYWNFHYQEIYPGDPRFDVYLGDYVRPQPANGLVYQWNSWSHRGANQAGTDTGDSFFGDLSNTTFETGLKGDPAGNVFSYSGTTDYAADLLGTSTVNPLTENFSLSFWVNVVAPAELLRRHNIITQGNFANAFGIQTFYRADGVELQAIVRSATATTSLVGDDVLVEYNTMNHVVLVGDSSGLRYYINGQQVGSAARPSGTFTPQNWWRLFQNAAIVGAASSNNNKQMKLSDLRLYKGRALTLKELRVHYGRPYHIGEYDFNYKALNLHGNAEDGYWTVRNNEIDIEIPSHLKPHGVIDEPSILNAKFNTWQGELQNWDFENVNDYRYWEEYRDNYRPMGIDVRDGLFHKFRYDWYPDRVEFYIDDVLIVTNYDFMDGINSLSIPETFTKITIGPWFPSGRLRWAGKEADWAVERMLVRRIRYTPYQQFNNSTMFVGETYPVASERDIPDENLFRPLD